MLWCDVVTEGAREQGPGVDGMSTRAASLLAWSMWALALMAFTVTGVLRFLNASTPTVEPRAPLVLDFWYLLLFMSFATVGALVASRQPGNALGWIFCYLGLSFPLAGAGEEYALYALVTEPGSLPSGEALVWLAALLGGPIVFAVFALFFLLFPNGRLLSRRWRLVVWLDLIAVVCLFAWAFEPGPLGNLGLVRIANPFGVEGLAALIGTLGLVGLFMTLAVAVAGASHWWCVSVEHGEWNVNNSSGSPSPALSFAPSSPSLRCCGTFPILRGPSGSGRCSSC